MPETPDEPVIQDLDGPDPRGWRENGDLWGLVKDLEALDKVAELMGAEWENDGMSDAYGEACRFIQAARKERRETLALMLLSMYGIQPSQQDAGASPFAAAGKPRAFGAGNSPPAGKLPLMAAQARPVRWVRLCQIGEAGLTADQVLAAIEMAMTELAIAMALEMIHGDRWPQVYKSLGGHIRFDDFGEPCVPVTLTALRPEGTGGRDVSTTTVWESGLTCDAEECGGEFRLGEEILYWYGRKLHPKCAQADAASRREASGESGDVMTAARQLLSSGARVILTRRQLRDLIVLAEKQGLEPVRKPDTGRCQWYGRMHGWAAERVRAGLSAAEVAGLWQDFLDAGRMPPLRHRDLSVIVALISQGGQNAIVTTA